MHKFQGMWPPNLQRNALPHFICIGAVYTFPQSATIKYEKLLTGTESVSAFEFVFFFFAKLWLQVLSFQQEVMVEGTASCLKFGNYITPLHSLLELLILVVLSFNNRIVNYRTNSYVRCWYEWSLVDTISLYLQDAIFINLKRWTNKYAVRLQETSEIADRIRHQRFQAL